MMVLFLFFFLPQGRQYLLFGTVAVWKVNIHLVVISTSNIIHLQQYPPVTLSNIHLCSLPEQTYPGAFLLGPPISRSLQYFSSPAAERYKE